MVWIVIAAAVVLVVALVAVRARRPDPRNEAELSHYHDGLDALSRIDENRMTR